MAHGRSRSGNVLVPLASGGRHECFLDPQAATQLSEGCTFRRAPLRSANSFLTLTAQMSERLNTGAMVRLRAPS